MRAIADDKTEALMHTLAAGASEGERTGRLAEASLEALRSNGFLDLWRPSALGGSETPPIRVAQLVEEVARVDPAAAWTMHGASAAWFDLRGADQLLLDEILESDERPVLCETFNGVMNAEPVSGGYRVTGRSAFASGCRWADWIGHTASTGDEFLLVFQPAAALEIEDDWHSLGMRGSASNSIVAEQAFVPEHRAIRLDAARTSVTAYDTPLYRAPEGLVPLPVAAACLGALRSALDAFADLAERKTPVASARPLRERALAQLRYGQALGLHRSARALLHETLENCWQGLQGGKPTTLQDKANLFIAYAQIGDSCRQAINLISRAAGTSAILEQQPFERIARDVLTMTQHAFVSEQRFASAAQAYLGCAIDFPLLEMD